jgi:hypothetical protein
MRRMNLILGISGFALGALMHGCGQRLQEGRMDGAETKQAKGFYGVPVSGVIEGTFVYADLNGVIRKVDSATGVWVWTVWERRGVGSATLANNRGVLVYSTMENGPGRIVGRDERTGAELWSVTTGGQGWYGGLMVGDLWVQGTDSGDVYGIDCRDGKVVWTKHEEDEKWIGGVLYKSWVVMVSEGGRVRALESGSGDQAWETLLMAVHKNGDEIEWMEVKWEGKLMGSQLFLRTQTKKKKQIGVLFDLEERTISQQWDGWAPRDPRLQVSE